MKAILSIFVILTASAAIAGPVLQNEMGTYSRYSNITLGGFSYGPGDVCVEGSKLVTMVAKSATFAVTEDGETVGSKTKTQDAGVSFEWQNRKSKVYDQDGEFVGYKTWKQNLAPNFTVTTCKAFADHLDKDSNNCSSVRELVGACE